MDEPTWRCHDNISRSRNLKISTTQFLGAWPLYDGRVLQKFQIRHSAYVCGCGLYHKISSWHLIPKNSQEFTKEGRKEKKGAKTIHSNISEDWPPLLLNIEQWFLIWRPMGTLDSLCSYLLYHFVLTSFTFLNVGCPSISCLLDPRDPYYLAVTQ